MFAFELLDLGGYTRDGLLEAGLRVCGLDGEGVEAGFGYVRCYVALSNNDAFALALAKTSHSVLLAADGALRSAAGVEDVEVHGHLWLLDEIEKHKALTRARLLAVLEAWENDPLVWLLADELKTPIRPLQRGCE